MDLGTFTRSKWRLAAWLVLPLVVMCAVYASGHLLQWRNSRILAERVSCLSSFRGLERALAQAGAVVEPFKLSNPANETDWNSTVYSLAGRHAITIRSVVRRSTKSAAAVGSATPELVVRAEGSIVGLSRFLFELERPERLLSIRSARLDFVASSQESLYQAEFVFRQRAQEPPETVARKAKVPS